MCSFSLFLDGYGQLNGEGRPFARLAVHGDPSIVSPHRFLHDRQAEASSASGLLGGEERLKNLRRMIALDAMPGVGDFTMSDVKQIL